jgi:hypothetical protein
MGLGANPRTIQEAPGMTPTINIDARKILGKMDHLPEQVRSNLRAVMPRLGKQLGAKIEENMASRLNSRNRLKVTKKMVENPRSITVTVSLDWIGEASKKLVPTYLEKGTKAHEIVAKHATVLAFYWPKINGWFFGPKVNHPGTKPYNLVADAWESQKDGIHAALTEAVRSAARQR